MNQWTTKWVLTVDQLASGGKTQRYGPYVGEGLLGEAVESAFSRAGLNQVSQGSYQITAVPYSDEALTRMSSETYKLDATNAP